MERNLNRVIATAPFLYAPSREPLDLGKLNDGGAVELNWERQSYGLRIFGALPEELPPGDCRVFLQLEQNGTALTFEAFPIYETELLGEEGTNGFSAFLPSEPELSGTWTVHVVTENTVFHTTKKDILRETLRKETVLRRQLAAQENETGVTAMVLPVFPVCYGY